MRPGPKVTAALLSAAVTAALGGVAASLWAVSADDRGIVGSVLSAAVIGGLVVVGAVVVAARPDNGIGWLMVAGGVAWSVGDAGTDLGYHGLVARPGAVAGASALAVTGSVIRSTGWSVVTIALPALYPDGRFAGPRWRWIGKAYLVVLVAGAVDPLTDPAAGLQHYGDWQNPLAPPGHWQAISVVAFLLHIPLSVILIGACVAQLAFRWRHGSSYQRQQVLLFACAAGLPIVAAPIALAVGGGGWVFGAAAVPLPFAIGFAVLARGLYDLRTAANRTLLWVALSSVVVGAYAVVIAGAGSVLHAGRADWLPWVAAAVVAVAFAPLRDGLQRAVNRLTFGRWDEPYDVLAGLGQRLEASADVERLLEDVVSELHALGLSEVALRDGAGQLVVGERVSPTAEQVPLTAYGRKVGCLSFRSPESPLRSRDRQLLDDLAGHLGGVLHAHALTLDVQRAREGLVLAREEERRRLRRDLHDGLGPSLAGHLLRLDVIAGRLGPDTPVTEDVTALRDELQTTVLEVRRVVEGLRPPALDELGLATALRQVTSRLVADAGLQLDLQLAELPVLSAATEVAAFRIVTEAVTNVVRHARAQRCLVSLSTHDGVLRVEVTDDGQGLGAGTGHGLQTMRERAEELRGRLVVTAQQGTTVVAELPLGAAGGPA